MLLTAKTTMLSTTGVQQGDPLGPLFFAAGLHGVLLEPAAISELLSKYYLDDGLHAGELPILDELLGQLQLQQKLATRLA